MSKKVLGRGLRALIPGPDAGGTTTADFVGPRDQPPVGGIAQVRPEEGESPPRPTTSISVDRIVRNHDQPRRVFDEDALESLANSIRIHGVIQPILVRPLAHGKYEIVAGERRWLAAMKAGLQELPAHVRDIPGSALLETALVENIQRQDLNPIEEAEAYKRLIDDLHLTQVDIALRVGRDRSSVANCLRLLSLPPATKDMVARGQISEGHGRALLQLRDPHAVDELANEAAASDWSVRQVEAKVRELTAPDINEELVKAPRSTKKGTDVDASQSPQIRSLVEELTSKFSSKVRVSIRADGRGDLSIEFYTESDLDRITGIILGR